MKKQVFLALLLAGFLAAWQIPGRGSEVNVIGAQRMLNAVYVDETASTAIGPGQMGAIREAAVYVVWGEGVTSGVVEVETAHDAVYAGTWAPLATVTFSGTAPKQDLVQITGVALSIRTRISTVVAGGTVSTYITGN